MTEREKDREREREREREGGKERKRETQREHPRRLTQSARATFFSTKLLFNCFWRNKIYYTDALLLLSGATRVVIFVAQKQ